jgi:CheY-like chemotaxis protein
LNNAAKFTDEGGTIDLDLTRAGNQAVFRVRDNGIGIPPEKLSCIFELFSQVDHSLERKHGGLGVGLNLVRRLVEKHGGSVTVQSEGANRGSEFVVRLPVLAQGHSAQGNNEALAVKSKDHTRRRILVVDDHPLAAETLMKMLQLRGHEVGIARDGPAAVEETHRFCPEIVLLDIGLPGMDGYQVAQSIRSLPGMDELILIALTGYGQEEDRRRSAETGFNHHLTKPVDPETLYRLISSQS